MLPSEYLSKKLTPYPLPTKDGGVLRTIDDARGYMLAMPKRRKLRAPWKHAWRLLLEEAGAAAFTRQVHLALSMDGKLDAAFLSNKLKRIEAACGDRCPCAFRKFHPAWDARREAPIPAPIAVESPGP